jgi:hypothetical protein
MRTPVDDELDRLLAALGWRASPRWKWWARLEILLGLFAAGAGVVSAVQLGRRPDAEVLDWVWLGPVLLVTLGGYLALAGHRSHLYQSNNRLAAYLAGLLRRAHDPPGPPHEHPG